MEKRIARTFLVVTALHHSTVGWALATYVLFLLDQGLTLFHANLLNVAFMSANVLLDPPTGNLADRVGQRRVHVLGAFFWGLGMLVYGSGSSFPVFLLAELTAAVGHSLISGALDSWLRNNLDEATTHKVLSKAGAISTLGSIPTALAGSIVGATWGFRWPWLMGGLMSMVVVFAAWLMLRHLPERPYVQVQKRQRLLTIPEVIRITLASRPLRFTVVITLVSALAFQPLNMFWSPILRDASGESWWLGFVWVGIAVTTSLGSRLAASRFIPLNGVGVALTLAAIGLPMLPTPFLGSIPVGLVAAFLAHEVGRGAIRPVLFTYANRHIEDHYRSTANSVRSAGLTLGAAIGLGLSGVLTFWLAPLTIWGLSAGILLLLAIWGWSQR